MSNFKSPVFNIDVREEDAQEKTVRVVKIGEPQKPSVRDFQLTSFQAGSGRNVGGARSALPQTTTGRIPAGASKRDQRFVMSELAREARSLGDEEERVIEMRVSERVAAISAKAREDAFRQGYDDGMKRGHADAVEKFQKECSERIEQVDTLMAALDGIKTELYEANRDFLMKVIAQVCKTVLLRELATDKEYLLRLSKELIERTPMREGLVLRIHPRDADQIEALREGLFKSISQLKNLTIETSDTVAQGGCILESELGAIDARIETQLQQVLSAISPQNPAHAAGEKAE